jgi:16S rRNA (cytidine1402-2'-O)-methyltransferase
MAGRLYLVATPIGNLGDISERTREVLGSVSLVAAEDTRRTGSLLKHLGIQSRITSYHDHNERQKTAALIEALESGEDVAVVTDAGTPGIADPGWHIVQAAIGRDIQLEVIPGPTAFVMALILSGLPVNRFAFEGYLPRKSGKRRRMLEELAGEPRTMIFYEAPYRLAKALGDMADVFGERRASVSRELTKLHEETRRGTLFELRDHASRIAPKGEFVIVVAGTSDPDAGGADPDSADSDTSQ